MTRVIIYSLVGCVILAAVGGFGAPLLCRGSNDDRCGALWRDAATGALAASGTLGTLLAKLVSDETKP